MTAEAPTGPGHVLVTTDAVGGVWHYSLALAAGLAALGTRCTLAVLGPAPDAAQSAAAAVIPGCTLVATGLALDWTADSRAALDAIAASLAALAHDIGATSAHLHAPCLAAQPWPIRTIAVAHSCMATWWHAVRGSALPPDIAWHADATRQGIGQATGIVAPSAAFAADLARCYATARPITVIHNGAPAPPATPAAFRDPIILAAGRLWDEGKNIAVLDRAAARLRWPIHAAGPRAAPAGNPASFPNLTLPGTLPPATLHHAMARAAVFAAPSLYEPFGLAVLEAAQTGAPLVLADIPTFRELWDGAALFVPATDEAAWAAALDGLMAAPPSRASLGAAAQTRAARYTQSAMAAATAALHARPALAARHAA